MPRFTFGGDRLGTGAGFTIDTRAYSRSTHNLGRLTRTNMGIGMLPVAYTNIVKRGDVWDIDLNANILTHPTNGPMYGSYEYRAAVFTADLRLYNKLLHNDAQDIGMNIKQVLWPQMRLNGKNIDVHGNSDWNAQQIDQSSLLANIGIRGLGTLEEPNGVGRVEIKRNALFLLAYWEMYKVYIANKQEGIGMVIGPNLVPAERFEIDKITAWAPGAIAPTYTFTNDGTGLHLGYFQVSPGYTYEIEGTNLVPGCLIVNERTGGETNFDEIGGIGTGWSDLHYYQDGQKATFNGYNGDTKFCEFQEDEGSQVIFKWNPTSEEVTNSLGLNEFPLTNIDDMREKIFAQPKTSPLTIGYAGEENHGLPYSMTVGQTQAPGGIIGPNSNMNSFYRWAGLGVVTYKADRWQTWLNSDWVENITNMSSVDTTGGSFTMDALNVAKRIYTFYNDVASSGGSYTDWLTAVDGMEKNGASETPVYRGGFSCQVTFDEVISSSEAGDQPLGTLGGTGTVIRKEGGKVRWKAEENSIVFIVHWLVPHIDYHQGNMWHTKLETLDDLHKPIYDAIGYQEKTTDQMAAWDTIVDPTTGEETFFSAGKEPAWTEYMSNWNENYGSFTRENDEAFMVLNRRYQMDENGRIEDLTTYVDPTKYLYPFAYIGLDYGPFWVQLNTHAEVRRIMSGAKQPHINMY